MPSELRSLLVDQLGRFDRAARAHGIRFHHIKLHGSLYHATERDRTLRSAFLETVRDHHPGVIVFALAGGRTVADARALGLEAWDEAFADRGYRDDGSLVPRGEPGAVIADQDAIADRVRHLAGSGTIVTRTGRTLSLPARTLCIHSDSPASLALVKAARDALTGIQRGGGA
jgi:UPF0271 protein